MTKIYREIMKSSIVLANTFANFKVVLQKKFFVILRHFRYCIVQSKVTIEHLYEEGLIVKRIYYNNIIFKYLQLM